MGKINAFQTNYSNGHEQLNMYVSPQSILPLQFLEAIKLQDQGVRPPSAKQISIQAFMNARRLLVKQAGSTRHTADCYTNKI